MELRTTENLKLPWGTSFWDLKMELSDESGFDSRPDVPKTALRYILLQLKNGAERWESRRLSALLWMHHGDGCFLTAASSVLAGLNNHLRFRAILMWWITQVDLLFLDWWWTAEQQPAPCLDMHDMRPTPLVLVETVIINISGGGGAQRRGTININANCDCEVWWHNKCCTQMMDVQRLYHHFSFLVYVYQ